MLTLWALLQALGAIAFLVLWHSLDGLREVKAVAGLLTIIAVVWLPAIRHWRLTGMESNPPIIVQLAIVVGAIMYEVITRFYLVR